MQCLSPKGTRLLSEKRSRKTKEQANKYPLVLLFIPLFPHFFASRFLSLWWCSIFLPTIVALCKYLSFAMTFSLYSQKKRLLLLAFD